LAMGAVSDAFGHPRYGFVLATIFAALLFLGLLLNWIYNPAGRRLAKLDSSEYRPTESLESQNIE
jgi:FHS family L-fucose permease-like MFS transporter